MLQAYLLHADDSRLAALREMAFEAKMTVVVGAPVFNLEKAVALPKLSGNPALAR